MLVANKRLLVHTGGGSSKIRGILLAALLSAPLAARAAEPPPAAQPAPAIRPAWIPPADRPAAAQRGDAEAQFELGMASHDPAVAVGWFRKAAEQGHADAQYRLGEAYKFGSGVAQDKAEALKWWRRAAEQGQAHAEFALGWSHEYGRSGLPRDAVEALRWYRRAAEHGLAEAQARLGTVYALGQGVPRDDREAVAWYRRAAAQNDSLGQVELGQMYAAGRGVAKDEQEAAKWYDRAAHQNVVTAMVLLGQAYAEGRGVQPDLARAYYWLALAAKLDANLEHAAWARDELAPKLSPRELAEAKRMLAAPPPPADESIEAPRLAGPAAMPKQGEFCPSLARVVAAAAANFVALRGKVSEKEGWVATEALPEMHRCAIERAMDADLPPYSYHCAVSEGADAAVAETDLENMRQLLLHCLGGSWRADESRVSYGTIVFFSSKRSGPLLVLSDRSFMDTHKVDLRVDPPEPSTTLERPLAGKAIDLDAPMDIKTSEAAAEHVFRSLGDTLAADLFLGAGAKGRVTLERKDVPLREVLDAVCAQAGCVWSFDTKGPRPQLSFRSKAGNLDEPIDMKVKGAESGEVFTSFGGVLAADVHIDSGVTGRVTLERENVPVREALDAVCAQVGCAWSLDTKGPKPQLFIHRKELEGHRR
ncbi:MAG TPA: tetratricopeptide repeat protein [Thermoanaerobaculia bacterium]|nr:tetratricopeptide repeat protein [Thermoanaerobaculia bacterium]